MVNDGRREGLGLGLVLAIWRFFVAGLLGLVGWCGIRNQGSFCWIALLLLLLLLLPLPLPCFVAGVVGRVFGSRGKKRGEC